MTLECSVDLAVSALCNLKRAKLKLPPEFPCPCLLQCLLLYPRANISKAAPTPSSIFSGAPCKRFPSIPVAEAKLLCLVCQSKGTLGSCVFIGA